MQTAYAPQPGNASWSRRGLLIAAPTEQPWAHSHAALPTVEELENEELRIYYSPRDEHGRAHIARAHLQLAPDGELEVLRHELEPILDPGPLGAFDDSGVTMSCVVENDAGTLLYYTGWTLGVSVPFYLYVGAAFRPHGHTRFRRVSAAPVLERSGDDPYLTASPWVLRDQGTWRMWYVSGAEWERVDGAPRHRYRLRYAESADGMRWRRDPCVAIDFADGDEYAMSRPCVVRGRDRYRMWFAARGDRYRLGYAESTDGVRWHRDDSRAGLDPALDGWDSEMITYPSLFARAGVEYLLYNGNGYGRSGIGYATRNAEA
jgi:hypothetical protein